MYIVHKMTYGSSFTDVFLFDSSKCIVARRVDV